MGEVGESIGILEVDSSGVTEMETEHKNLLKRINKADTALWGIFREMIQFLKSAGFSKGTIREVFDGQLKR